jgi:hypothetical protein
MLIAVPTSLMTLAETRVESASGFLAEVEQELRRGGEEDGVAGLHGLEGDVLGDHGLALALGRDEDDIARAAQEVESQSRLDGALVDALGP